MQSFIEWITKPGALNVGIDINCIFYIICIYMMIISNRDND